MAKHLSPAPRLAAVLALTVLTLCAALPARAGEQKRAALALQWQPQAQFAGFYVAKEKGFYTEAGVDLTIIPGGPDVVASKLLASGRAQFATMFLATGIERRAGAGRNKDGLPVVLLAQLVQRSALMLITRADSAIRTPQDLDGKRVGLWDNEFRLQPLALFQRLGIHPVIKPQSNTLNLFLRGGVDAASAMWYNEYHSLLASGLDAADLRVFFYRDLDLNFPEDGLYALEATQAADPDLCRAVTSASLRGWEYAFAHPDEALDIVQARMREAHLPSSRAHQRFMLARLQDVMSVPGLALGSLDPADYARVTEALAAQKLIQTRPSLDAFFKGQRR
ncbi:MAG: ABC transporter substrate-binding protein [Desulfovibrionales bacterium GWA2_65_9]|nr:MAG: ABC transporter substrate-binding protein [Desulfovibrionales bacterium GWA2_65_9]